MEIQKILPILKSIERIIATGLEEGVGLVVVEFSGAGESQTEIKKRGLWSLKLLRRGCVAHKITISMQTRIIPTRRE